MAIKPTIYKLRVAVSDFNREFYDSVNLTLALHPSENLPRMMARVVAYCMNAQEHLTFTKGLSAVEEPDIWVKTLDEQIKLWIEVGEPSPERIKKSSRLSPAVIIYSFNSKSDTWWEQCKNKVQPFANVTFYQINWSQIEALASAVERNMDWSLSVSGDTVYIATQVQEYELEVKPLN